MNPYYLSEWRKDKQHGPLFEERLAEMQRLENELSGLDSVAKEEWANKLEATVREHASPEMRLQAIKCLAQIQSPTSVRALTHASSDDVLKVRLAVCDAWQLQGGTEARNMLLSIAVADEESSVRQAAIEALSSYQDPEVIRTLGTLLDDSSPAIEYSAVQSLTAITGQDYGGDRAGWKTFIDSSVPATSLPGPGLESAGSNIMTAAGENRLP